MKEHTQELLEKVGILVKAADDRRGQDIVVLDVAQLTPIADYFVIVSANNDRQMQAVVDSVLEAAHKQRYDVKGIEGKGEGRWTLIDLNDVIVHIFHHEARSHYQLEKIWHEAPMINTSQWISEP